MHITPGSLMLLSLMQLQDSTALIIVLYVCHCVQRGCMVKGKKSDIVERLREKLGIAA